MPNCRSYRCYVVTRALRAHLLDPDLGPVNDNGDDEDDAAAADEDGDVEAYHATRPNLHMAYQEQAKGSRHRRFRPSGIFE